MLGGCKNTFSRSQTLEFSENGLSEKYNGVSTKQGDCKNENSFWEVWIELGHKREQESHRMHSRKNVKEIYSLLSTARLSTGKFVHINTSTSLHSEAFKSAFCHVYMFCSNKLCSINQKAERETKKKTRKKHELGCSSWTTIDLISGDHNLIKLQKTSSVRVQSSHAWVFIFSAVFPCVIAF